MIQLLYVFGIVVLGLGLGIGGTFWFLTRRQEAQRAVR